MAEQTFDQSFRDMQDFSRWLEAPLMDAGDSGAANKLTNRKELLKSLERLKKMKNDADVEDALQDVITKVLVKLAKGPILINKGRMQYLKRAVSNQIISNWREENGEKKDKETGEKTRVKNSTVFSELSSKDNSTFDPEGHSRPESNQDGFSDTDWKTLENLAISRNSRSVILSLLVTPTGKKTDIDPLSLWRCIGPFLDPLSSREKQFIEWCCGSDAWKGVFSTQLPDAGSVMDFLRTLSDCVTVKATNDLIKERLCYSNRAFDKAKERALNILPRLQLFWDSFRGLQSETKLVYDDLSTLPLIDRLVILFESMPKSLPAVFQLSTPEEWKSVKDDLGMKKEGDVFLASLTAHSGASLTRPRKKDDIESVEDVVDSNKTKKTKTPAFVTWLKKQEISIDDYNAVRDFWKKERDALCLRQRTK